MLEHTQALMVSHMESNEGLGKNMKSVCTPSGFHRLGEAKFLQKYKLKMNDSFGTALKAIEEEGKKDGTIQCCQSKKSSHLL